MTLDELVRARLKPISNISQEKVVVCAISETSRILLNESIEQKIKENKLERMASKESFSNYFY